MSRTHRIAIAVSLEEKEALWWVMEQDGLPSLSEVVRIYGIVPALELYLAAEEKGGL